MFSITSTSENDPEISIYQTPWQFLLLQTVVRYTVSERLSDHYTSFLHRNTVKHRNSAPLNKGQFLNKGQVTIVIFN